MLPQRRLFACTVFSEGEPKLFCGLQRAAVSDTKTGKDKDVRQRGRTVKGAARPTAVTISKAGQPALQSFRASFRSFYATVILSHERRLELLMQVGNNGLASSSAGRSPGKKPPFAHRDTCGPASLSTLTKWGKIGSSLTPAWHPPAQLHIRKSTDGSLCRHPTWRGQQLIPSEALQMQCARTLVHQRLLLTLHACTLLHLTDSDQANEHHWTAMQRFRSAGPSSKASDRQVSLLWQDSYP